MPEDIIQVTITVSDPQLDDEKLQEIVQTLRSELEEIDGVEEADLVPVETAPPGSKSIGGFLLGTLKTLVDLKELSNLVKTLGQRLFGQTIKIEAEGNGRKLKVEISRPEDLAKVLPEVEKFIKG